MKQTAFTKYHDQLGAKMIEFAGYYMPLEYSGVTDEHLCVRNNVGVFDVSHMGEFWIKGDNAYNMVQKLTSNDVSLLTAGKIQYSCFPNGKGGIVDDLLVYCYDDKKYMLVVNAANIQKDWEWIVKNNDVEAEIENISDRISQLAIQGPRAIEVLQKLTSINLSQIQYYTFVTDKMADIDEVIISCTGYTGAGGFELYVHNNYADKLWKAIFEAGKEYGIKPIGLAARDTLRLEAGFCLYGNDIDETTSPIEAGLGWITKFTEPNKFIDRELLWQQKQLSTSRLLKGFVMLDKGIPRHGYEITDANGINIGTVTSGTMSPILKRGIGLGYVAKTHIKIDSDIFIKVRNKLLKAKIVKPPFFNLKID